LASYYGIVFFGRENALFSAFLRKNFFVAKFIAAISWMLVQFQLVQFSMLLYTLWHITRTCKNEHATLDKVPA